jgi:hypothetical protein
MYLTCYLLHCHRVTGHKVSEEEAHGEGMAASPHRRSQGEQPARATKKAPRQKEISFYSMVYKALMENRIFSRKRRRRPLPRKLLPLLPSSCTAGATGRMHHIQVMANLHKTD